MEMLVSSVEVECVQRLFAGNWLTVCVLLGRDNGSLSPLSETNQTRDANETDKGIVKVRRRKRITSIKWWVA